MQSLSQHHLSEPDQHHELTLEQRELAGQLWQALMFAPSLPALDGARLMLKAASLPVQGAIMNAIVTLWAHNSDPEENPFA